MSSSDRTITGVLRLFLLVGFATLASYLFNLQVVRGSYYQGIAENNYVRLVRVPPVRGEIFDRRNRPLVVNIPTTNLYITPGRIENRQLLTRFLQRHLGVSAVELEELLFENRFNPHGDALLFANVPFNICVRIAENQNYYPSLSFRRENGRRNLIPAHFLGYIGGIGEEEYQRLAALDYKRNEFLGKAGLEKTYELLLRGEAGYEVRQVDARGMSLDLLRHNLQKGPKPGLQLMLTIDLELQNYTRELLSPYERAAAVVIDPRTGGVLAWVSQPEFDQNRFMRRISNQEWQELMDNPARPLLDRVLQGTYPPGSVFKPITASLGLERNVITPDEKLASCNGGMQVGNRWFACWNEHGHGRSALTDAIKVSCDVYFYDLSSRLDLDDWQEWTRQNGWIDETGIDLPSQRSGFFPNSDWYIERFGRDISLRGHKVNLAIGQGEALTSPLHVCCYYAALANGGTWRTPHFFRKVIGENASSVNQAFAPEQRRLPISERTLSVLREGLWKVVNEERGTGQVAQVEGAVVYGKTGSAENHQGELTHAWFVCWAEWNEPEIAVTVFMENAGHGGSVAAPVAKQILDYYARNMRTNP
ncbi:MAG: penicillin-binding protein 2 [Candidatus Cloacimonetes bacterium]|nr:penicillin-binding protein 2 [Candidatus Cloacimonadota bacterium]